MSLQVWLPLTKDLRQQGLSNIDFVNTGVTLVSSGKLGEKCGSFESSKRLYSTNVSIGSIFSISAWVNFKTFGSYINRCITSLVGYDSNNNVNVQFQLGCLSSDGNVAQWKLNDDGNCGAINLNTWYHICVTYDNNQAYIYENGQLINTFSISLPAVRGNILSINGLTNKNDGSTVSSASTFILNDFRLYDHCLSPMEVKKLAKGLILHYPLNRQGWGQENNIAASKIANRGCSNFIYNSSTNEWTMTCPTASSTWGYGIVFNDRDIRWATSQTWVVSMEVYTPRSITWNCDINNKPDLADISEYTGNDYDITGQRLVCTNGVKGNKTLQVGWNKIWFSQTANTTYGLTNYSTNWGIVTTNEASTIDIKIKNIKGEVIATGLSVQPTPWCPNSSDALATTMGLNSTTEYDCSGFCNNGTRTGTFIWTSDTPKYAVSTHIGTTSSKIHISNFPTSGFGNSYSFAWWGKRSSNSPMFWGFSDGIRLNGMYSGTLWNTGDSSNNPIYKPGTTTTITAPSVNVWHHYVMTGDGTACKLYVDGVFYGQAKTYKAISGTSIYINGWNSDTTYCSDNTDISDFRIYATALSADDVKSLYQNCATIDPDGTIRGQIRS